MGANWIPIVTVVGVILLAVLYQASQLPPFIAMASFRHGQDIQSVEDFPYNCRRVRHELLEGCEDMWIDDEARTLYAACTSSLSRSQWCPAMERLNSSRNGGDHVSVLKIDEPGDDGLFGLHQLSTVGYEGVTEDGTLDVHGFDVEVINESTLRFWMVNHRPPVDENKKLLDATKVGANSTIEVFDVIRGSNDMVHVKTISHEVITTPNNIALTGDGGFVMTNDRSSKVGLRRQLEPIFGGGNVAHCGSSGCHIAASSGFNLPNGLVKGKDSLYYIPSTFTRKITVMRLQPDLTLKEVDVINLGMPVDNLSVDKITGDIYAAAFPDVLKLVKSFDNPYEIDSPSAIWRIRQSGSGYDVKKILEDRDTKAVGGATVAVHDARTGRLFMGGVVAPYMTVCDPI